MAQHFLLSKAAKTLTLAQVMRMTDAEAEATFKAVRWADTQGQPVCPKCGSLDAYECRRPNGANRFRCSACRKDFSITSGTLFASHKLPLRGYLAAIAIFCNEVKGKSALALSRDLGLSYKSAFVLLHKLREAMAEEMKGRVVGGEGKEAEIDGGIFRRLCEAPPTCASIALTAAPRTRPASARPWSSCASATAIRSRPCSRPKARPSTSSGRASRPAPSCMPTKRRHGMRCTRRFEMKRINHQEAYSLDGACTNWAEEFFSRMRRVEIGHHHHIAGAYLLRYAQEASWREDNRRMSNGEQVNRLAGLAVKRGKSVDFTGYWQRHVRV